MTTQRKICSAVLTLAAVAFGVDHWLIGGANSASSPSQASAAALIAGPASVAKSAARHDAGVAKAPPRSLAARLQAAAEVERLTASDVADAFRPSDKLIPPPPPPAVTAAGAIEAPKVDPGVQFRSTHKVSAVMNSGRGSNGGMALVNGRTILAGQQIDGFTLMSVNVQARTAAFTDGAARAELKIELKQTEPTTAAR